MQILNDGENVVQNVKEKCRVLIANTIWPGMRKSSILLGVMVFMIFFMSGMLDSALPMILLKDQELAFPMGCILCLDTNIFTKIMEEIIH